MNKKENIYLAIAFFIGSYFMTFLCVYGVTIDLWIHDVGWNHATWEIFRNCTMFWAVVAVEIFIFVGCLSFLSFKITEFVRKLWSL